MVVTGSVHTLTALLLQKEPDYPSNRKLGMPWSGHCGEEKNLLPPPGFKT